MLEKLDMSADGNMLDLKRSFKCFTIFKGMAKFFGNNHLYFILEKIIKIAANKNIDVKINNSSKGSACIEFTVCADILADEDTVRFTYTKIYEIYKKLT